MDTQGAPGLRAEGPPPEPSARVGCHFSRIFKEAFRPKGKVSKVTLVTASDAPPHSKVPFRDYYCKHLLELLGRNLVQETKTGPMKGNMKSSSAHEVTRSACQPKGSWSLC